MAVPDFQSMMLPFLQFAADGKDHELSEVTEYIANHFKLTQQERDELLPSGNQTRLFNRVGWCRTHLKYALMIEYVRRGVFRITVRGLRTLEEKPPVINLKYLDQFGCQISREACLPDTAFIVDDRNDVHRFLSFGTGFNAFPDKREVSSKGQWGQAFRGRVRIIRRQRHQRIQRNQRNREIKN